MTASPSNGPALTFWRRRRVPPIVQSGASECGLVCIAMVAGYWGHVLDMATLRRRFSVSLKGSTVKTLVHIASQLEMRARPLKAGLEQLGQVKLPAVLHWDLNHFVVLESISATRAIIHDPIVGKRVVSIAELSDSYTGVAIEMTPAAAFRKHDEKVSFSLRSLMGDVKGLGSGLVQLLLLGLFLQVVVMIMPFQIQWVVDEALVSGDRSLVTVIGMGFLLLVGLQFVVGAVRSWIVTVLSTDLSFQWFSNTFAHLLRLPLRYFEDRHLGDIVSRFGSIQTIQRAVTTQLVEGVIDGLLVIFTLAAMFLYSTKLALIACAAVAIYVLIRFAGYRSLLDATAESVMKAARQDTVFLESVRGMQAVRLFGRASERHSLWTNTLADQMNVDLKIARLSLTFRSASTLLFGAERVIIVWVGALVVLDSALSVGMMFAFLSYMDQFTHRAGALTDRLFDLRLLRVQGERLADIVLTEPEEGDEGPEIDIAGISPDIELRNVSFRYADHEPYVLKDISLQIPAGQCIAISGPSGCGKTTLVKLMLGLLRPTAGDILVGGSNIGTIGLANFRKMTGSVMQEDMLFSGSIADNIAFFDPAPDRARVEECARLASVNGEIVSMPMGYETLIGDLGTGLSGGQKQRVVLARALYRQPRILVLDEATSHLDLVNELTINNAIAHLAMTRIVIAHRPDTIAMAERIVMLSEGEVCLDQPNSRLAPPPASQLIT